MTEQEEFEIMDGMNQVNMEMAAKIQAEAPMCHSRKMFFNSYYQGDEEESWWECSVCGHIKMT